MGLPEHLLSLWTTLLVVSTNLKYALAFGSMGTILLNVGKDQVSFTLCAIRPGSLIPACYQTTNAYNGTYSPNEKLWAITGGLSTSCGLTYDSRNAVCWGDASTGNSEESSIVPSKYRNFNYTSISSGGWHTCAVRDSGVVDCWGWNSSYNETEAPSFTMRSVSAGQQFSCGIRSNDSKISMWGIPLGGIEEHGLQYDTISAGGYHVCGIEKGTKKTVCWGNNDHSQVYPPNAYNFSSIASGEYHSCGLRDDNHQAVCWGLNEYNILDAPAGVPFAFITASAWMTCGVSLDKGEIVCWGAPNQSEIDRLQANRSPCSEKCENNQYGISSGSNCPSSDDKFCLDCTVCSLGALQSSPCQDSTDRVCSTPPPASPPELHTGKISKTFPLSIVVGAVVGAIMLIGAVIMILCLYFRLKGQHSVWHHQDNRIEEFTVSQLRKATSNYSSAAILGRGASCLVYKGTLEDGRVVAIKKAIDLEKSRFFDQELMFLRSLNHTSLVNLVGYCKLEKILVFEYMEHGSLYDCLFEQTHQLSWQRRMRIATQASRGLEYLHNFASPQVIHRDVKASNILLDTDWNAHVSDFGLSVVGPLPRGDTHLSNMSVVGTPGYLDPEYHQTNRLTLKSDVYSFGVVLLELLRGKQAFLILYDMDHIEKANIVNMLDPSLPLPSDPTPLVEAFELALQCVNPNGTTRPTMEIVFQSLEKCLKNLNGEWSM